MDMSVTFDYSDHYHCIDGKDVHCTALSHCPSFCDCPIDKCDAQVCPQI